MFTDGDAEMDLLSDLFANGKVSRLYQVARLRAAHRQRSDGVSELARARRVLAGRRHGGARPHARRAASRRSTRSLTRLTEEGPTADEMERGHAQIEAQFVYRLQTLGGFGGKADQLNAYSVFVNDPGYFERDLARYASVTQRRSASRGANVPSHRQSGGVERRAERQAVARAAGLHAGGGVMSSRGRPLRALPDVGPPLPFRFSAIHKDRLPNRLSLWSAEHRSLPVVTFMLVLPVGSAADFEGYEGLAAMTGGHDGRGHGQPVGDRRQRGLRADRRPPRHRRVCRRDVFTVTALAKFSRQALSLLADCVIRPRLDVADFDRIRQLRLTRLVQIRDMPSAIADRAFMQVVYGTHPYAHMALGTEESLRQLTIDTVKHVSFAAVPRVECHAHRVGRHRRGRVRSNGGRRLRVVDGRRILRFPRTPRSPRRRRRRSIGFVHRRQAGRGAERDSHRRSRAGAKHARLPSADRAEHDSRRAVRQPHQHEAAPGEGADLRRAGRRSTSGAGAGRSSCRRACRATEPPKPSQSSLLEIHAIRTDRPPTAEEVEVAKAALTRGYRAEFRDGRTDCAGDGPARAVWPCQTTISTPLRHKCAEVTVERARQVAATHLDPDRLATAIVSDSSIVLPQLAAAGLGEPIPLLPRLVDTMRSSRLSVSLSAGVAVIAAIFAGALIWLLLSDPVTVADAVETGEVAPSVRRSSPMSSTRRLLNLLDYL